MRGLPARPPAISADASDDRGSAGRAEHERLFEADDLDTAIELAARTPSARLGGSVEIRPVLEDRR
jgi:hypothetical protein